MRPTAEQHAPPVPDAPGETVLEMIGITKRYPGVVACDDIRFDLRRGEVHALLGENGAGKLTLMNVLYGLTRPDEGEIQVRGEPVEITAPGDAIALGIGMVHQHFMLIPVMTVAENIVLAIEPTQGGVLIDRAEASARVREISDRFGLAVDPDALVQDITVGMEQRVEILKALYRGAEILILDEPTAVLTPQETAELAAILRSLTAQGTSIIFITHKLNEVLDIADRVTVLRHGRYIATEPTAGATEASLARFMVGRDVVLAVEKPPARPGPGAPGRAGPRRARRPRARGRERPLAAGGGGGDRGGRGRRRQRPGRAHRRDHGPARADLRDDHRRRAGHHRREPASRCSTRASDTSPRTASGAGWCWTSPWRRTSPSTTSTSPPRPTTAGCSRGASSRPPSPLLTEFDVRGGGARTPAGSLSGGNQQKVIIAREVSRDPAVLVASQPTRGLDVGAIEYVHRRLVTERDEGRAILLVSLELEEILSLSDRILVIYEGRIVAEFPSGASREALGGAMLGARPEAP